MRYPYHAIEDSDVPRAANPILQHLLDTYASETNKVVSVWRCFAPEDLDFRPHPKSSSVREILQHQLLSGAALLCRIHRHTRTPCGRRAASVVGSQALY